MIRETNKRSGFEIQCVASASTIGVISVYHVIVVSEDGNYKADLNSDGTLTGFAKHVSSNYIYSWQPVSERSKYIRELIAHVESDPGIKQAYIDVRKSAILKAVGMRRKEIEGQIEQLQSILDMLKSQLWQYGINEEAYDLPVHT